MILSPQGLSGSWSAPDLSMYWIGSGPDNGKSFRAYTSDTVNGVCYPGCAFNGSYTYANGTIWQAQFAPKTIVMDFVNRSVQVTRYKIWNQNYYTTYSWQLYGGMRDDWIYNLVDERSGIYGEQTGTVYICSNPGNYQYYKLIGTVAGSEDFITFIEIELWDETTPSGKLFTFMG